MTSPSSSSSSSPPPGLPPMPGYLDWTSIQMAQRVVCWKCNFQLTFLLTLSSVFVFGKDQKSFALHLSRICQRSSRERGQPYLSSGKLLIKLPFWLTQSTDFYLILPAVAIWPVLSQETGKNRPHYTYGDITGRRNCFA